MRGYALVATFIDNLRSQVLVLYMKMLSLVHNMDVKDIPNQVIVVLSEIWLVC